MTSPAKLTHTQLAILSDEVALPMAGLAAAFNGLRTIMDRRSILDGVDQDKRWPQLRHSDRPVQIVPRSRVRRQRRLGAASASGHWNQAA